MRKFFLLLAMLPVMIAGAQTIQKAPVVAFINGNPNISLVDKDFFKTDFEVQLSDSSLEIVSFFITWHTEDAIHARPVKGSIVRIGGDFSRLSDLSLKAPVTFENIKVRKRQAVAAADTSFSVPPFYVTTTDAETARRHRQNLAPCYPFLASHGGKDILWVRELLSGDFILKLSDPSYTIVGADMEIFAAGQSYDVPLSGDRVGINHPVAGPHIRRFAPGSSLLFTNVKASKNGKIYDLKNVNVYIR
jgi:hypothetical protein